MKMKRTNLRGIIALLVVIQYLVKYHNNGSSVHRSVIENVRLDLYVAETKPESFFFIHCPKTGTSLFTVLRNSLDSCVYKNFTCFGVKGGGYHLKKRQPVYPFDHRIMFPNITANEAHNINTCNGSLPNCEEKYHCPYNRCGYYKNKVTMIRNPYKWFPSYANWIWAGYASGGMSMEAVLPFQSQISFITGSVSRYHSIAL